MCMAHKNGSITNYTTFKTNSEIKNKKESGTFSI